MNKLKIASKKEYLIIPHNISVTTTVEGHRTNIDGVECFIHFDEDDKVWVISHFESGCQISKNKSKMAVGAKAFMVIMNNKENIVKEAKKVLSKCGFDYPLNKMQ